MRTPPLTQKKIKMARPRNSDKTIFKQWNAFLPEEQYEELMRCYKSSGCTSKVQFLCHICRHFDSISAKTQIDESVIDELMDGRRLLNNVSNNVNQVAKQVNVLGYAAEHEDIRRSLESLLLQIEEVKKISEKMLKKAYKIVG